MNFKKIMNRFIKAEEPEEEQDVSCMYSGAATAGNVYSFRPGEVITIPTYNAAVTSSGQCAGNAVCSQNVTNSTSGYGVMTVTFIGGNTSPSGTFYTYDYENTDLYNRAKKIFAVPEYELL